MDNQSHNLEQSFNQPQPISNYQQQNLAQDFTNEPYGQQDPSHAQTFYSEADHPEYTSPSNQEHSQLKVDDKNSLYLPETPHDYGITSNIEQNLEPQPHSAGAEEEVSVSTEKSTDSSPKQQKSNEKTSPSPSETSSKQIIYEPPVTQINQTIRKETPPTSTAVSKRGKATAVKTNNTRGRGAASSNPGRSNR